MKRRDFLQQAGSLSILGPVAGGSGRLGHESSGTWEHANAGGQELEDLMTRLRFENNVAVARLLDSQNADPGSEFVGGVPTSENLYHAGSPAGLILRAAISLGEPGSRFFGSGAVVEAMQLAAAFLVRTQHEDGTIDLLTTNFHSTPDTGFVVEPLCIAYGLLKEVEVNGVERLLETLGEFLLKAGDALAVGGIHTPNHRWVVSMALARINVHFPNQRYVDRIEQWLREKIDIDNDGQYTERSVNIYSPLTNRCLITLARLLDKPELLEPVRRNLDMTLYYLHPNGELATEASGRQDQYQIGRPTEYYYSYRYLALLDGNGRYAAMCRKIETEIPAAQLFRGLSMMLEDPGLTAALPESQPLPEDYVQTFAGSNLVRIRRKGVDATVLGGNTSFFTFSSGAAVLQAMRLVSAFFGKGQFSSEVVGQEGEKWILERQLEGPYYQPHAVEHLSGDGNWEKMPRSLRPQSEVQRQTTRVEITETNGTIELYVEVSGTDHVPVALELAFRKGGVLSGVTTVSGVADSYMMEGEKGSYTMDGDKITFGPGHAAHSWTQLRGASPKLDAMSVYLTGYAPVSWQLTLE